MSFQLTRLPSIHSVYTMGAAKGIDCLVTEPLTKICCTSITAWLWVPNSCPGLTAKVKVVGFPDKRVHLHDKIITSPLTLRCCCILVKVQPRNDCMKYLRHFRLYIVREYFLKWATHVWCNFTQGTEMQHVGFLNIWEFIATSNFPAALLHPSDEQQVGWCNAWVLIASSTWG